MVSKFIVNGTTYGIIIFIGSYCLWYFWHNLGLKKAYHSLFSGKKKKAIKNEIIFNNLDKLKGDAKIEAYLKNPIISKAIPELITQSEIEIENEKPIQAMKQFIREELAKSNFQNSPMVYETIKLALLRQGFKESFIKRTIKQIQKETKHGARQIWRESSPSASREAPRIDAGANNTNASSASVSNSGGFAKPGNIPVGTLEAHGTAQQLDDRASPSNKGKSKYFD